MIKAYLEKHPYMVNSPKDTIKRLARYYALELRADQIWNGGKALYVAGIDGMVKIGLGEQPIKRLSKIGFNLFNPSHKIALFAMPDNVYPFRCEQLAHYYAKQATKRQGIEPEYYQFTDQEYLDNLGFIPTSGQSEFFAVTFKQAVGCASMARNNLESGKREFKTMSSIYSFYNQTTEAA